MFCGGFTAKPWYTSRISQAHLHRATKQIPDREIRTASIIRKIQFLPQNVSSISRPRPRLGTVRNTRKVYAKSAEISIFNSLFSLSCNDAFDYFSFALADVELPTFLTNSVINRKVIHHITVSATAFHIDILVFARACQYFPNLSHDENEI